MNFLVKVRKDIYKEEKLEEKMEEEMMNEAAMEEEEKGFSIKLWEDSSRYQQSSFCKFCIQSQSDSIYGSIHH